MGKACTIGKWARLEPLTVIAENVQVKDELFINGAKILPHKGISGSYYEKGTIIM